MTNSIQDLVSGEKTEQYGNPVESMKWCAMFWDIALKRMGFVRATPLISREACHLMEMFKISRDLGKPKQDNITDIQGYAHIIDLITKEEVK